MSAAPGDRSAEGSRVSLVLLPSLDGSGVLFRPLIRCLSPELRPIVVAFPPDRMLGYEELLPLVLERLPASEPFVLLGESFSGPLALMAAATRPANLRGLILCASFIRSPIRFCPRILGFLARPAVFRLFPVLSRVKSMLRRGVNRELPALSAEALSQVRPAVLAHRVRAVLQVNVVEQLRACAVPVLYLLAGKDHVVRQHNVQEICAALPTVSVARIQSSHWLLQTCPDAGAQAIATFVHDIQKNSSATIL
jgi:pimeloyl-ACP methyl ester carboxylesterase